MPTSANIHRASPASGGRYPIKFKWTLTHARKRRQKPGDSQSAHVLPVAALDRLWKAACETTAAHRDKPSNCNEYLGLRPPGRRPDLTRCMRMRDYELERCIDGRARKLALPRTTHVGRLAAHPLGQGSLTTGNTNPNTNAPGNANMLTHLVLKRHAAANHKSRHQS